MGAVIRNTLMERIGSKGFGVVSVHSRGFSRTNYTYNPIIHRLQNPEGSVFINMFSCRQE
jgi:predicted alpha/beta-fold hydrolase